jgi:hypothetical protein
MWLSFHLYRIIQWILAQFRIGFLIIFFEDISIKLIFSLAIEEFLSMPGETNAPLEFEQVPFTHPLFIISIFEVF